MGSLRRVILSYLSDDLWSDVQDQRQIPTQMGRPFVVEIIDSSGAYLLTNLNDDKLMTPINDK